LNVFGFVNKSARTSINHNDGSVLVQRTLLQMLMIEVRFLERSAAISVVQGVVDSTSDLSTVLEVTEVG
jgi:hypothetical protein